MNKYRKYIKIKCPDCRKLRTTRADGIDKISGRCMSCSKKNDWNKPEYAKKCSDSHKGKIMLETTKKKISQKNSGRIKSPEECKNISEGRKKEYGYASARHLFTRYRTNAKKRKHIFTLTVDEFIDITSKKCRYCGASPKMVSKPHSRVNGEYVHNGVDRKDNNIGYTIKNSVPCCTHCNYAKHKMSVKEFREWINRVYHYEVDTVGSRQVLTK